MQKHGNNYKIVQKYAKGSNIMKKKNSFKKHE